MYLRKKLERDIRVRGPRHRKKFKEPKNCLRASCVSIPQREFFHNLIA